jgi:Phasin protein
MTQIEVHGEQTETSSLPDPAPADLAARARQRMEAFANAQTKLLQNVEETNRQWLIRVQAEAKLASEFISKLSAVRSVPDTLTAYRDWMGRRFDMMAEDTQHIVNNTQKFVQMGAHLFKDSSPSSGN